MSVNSNLFPPIVKDTMPAFVRTQTCRIYFALSSFNSPTDIAHAQVTVINQNNNQNALTQRLGIKFTNIELDTQITDDYKYYITINPTIDIIGGSFELNRFYKVQIRFDDIENIPVNPDADWINDPDNYNHFSEWSSVCLIKGIEQPYIYINGLGTNDPEDEEYHSSTTFIIPPTSLSGQLYYNNNVEKETLKTFRIMIDDEDNQTVIDSGNIYTDQYHPNQFSYQLNYDLEKQIHYFLTFYYTTINSYQGRADYQFYISKNAENQLHAMVETVPEEDSGRIKISIAFKEMFNTERNLIIRRASSNTNFTKWENIKTLAHNRDFQHLWYDTTIESGIWYKYRVQEDGVDNARISNAGDPIMCVFDDIFLTNRDRQLKVQFNPNISDLRYNVNESQQVTLGAQYPYVRRNGNNYYRTFSIGGLISSLIDQQGWYNPNYNEKDGYFYHKNVAEPFTSPEELYAAATDLYDGYNAINNITQYNDYIYQREFRQKVMEFLYKNDVKLFRSLTQGNILVKLTNITLSPISTIGRMLYSFSATATQIDQLNLNNLTKYNLINKFYYTYDTYTITDTFENEKSLINRFYEQAGPFTPQQKKLIDIMQLTFLTDGTDEVVVYAKPINNKQLFRYTINEDLIIDGQNEGKYLVLKYSDADPIAESFFWGIHVSPDIIINTNEYYYSTDDVQNPQNYGVYYIIKQSVYRVDHYAEWFNEMGILGTYPEQVVQNSNDPTSHALLVEPDYIQMIYYNGNWYPFSENQDIMINEFPATIEYLYRIKKEG